MSVSLTIFACFSLRIPPSKMLLSLPHSFCCLSTSSVCHSVSTVYSSGLHTPLDQPLSQKNSKSQSLLATCCIEGVRIIPFNSFFSLDFCMVVWKDALCMVCFTIIVELPDYDVRISLTSSNFPPHQLLVCCQTSLISRTDSIFIVYYLFSCI